MLLEDIKKFFCELINELFKNKEHTITCGLNCNCNK